MRFAVVSAFLPTEEIAAVARAADELGYRTLTVADHVVDLETIATPYPYTADGSRRWDTDCEWPDPWVLIGALSAVTTRLRFMTSVYVSALRSPFQVAKSVGTAAVLSGGRVTLGVGAGWCREEFEVLGQDFATRGARTDEGLALMRELWTPGWTAHEGRFHSAPRLTMRPEPATHIPVLVGGMSDAALRRAARHDGWIGDTCTIDEAIAIAGHLRELRAEAGIETPAEVIPALTDAVRPEDFARAREGGVTEVMTAPWFYYRGLGDTPGGRIEGLHRFKADVMDALAE